jgi:hypothetical protein
MGRGMKNLLETVLVIEYEYSSNKTVETPQKCVQTRHMVQTIKLEDWHSGYITIPPPALTP